MSAIIKAISETIQQAKTTGNLCYLFEDGSGYRISSEYNSGWLFQAYPGGRKVLSMRGKQLVEAEQATERPE